MRSMVFADENTTQANSAPGTRGSTNIRNWKDSDSRHVLGTATLLFAAITALRFLASDDPGEPYTALFVVPIALIANRYGVVGGVLASCLGLGLYTGWAVAEAVGISAQGWLIRAFVFSFVGIGMGRIRQIRSQEERENSRWFSMSNQMLSEANFEGYLTRVNDAWEECLGYTKAEMLARPYFELVHPDDQQPTIDLAAALSDKDFSVVSFRNRYRAKDGSWRWLSWSARSDSDRIYASAKDITDVVELEAERNELLSTITAMAHTDALTSLPNRRAWDEEVARELSRSKRLGFDLSVAMIDLDRFKSFNDRYGHPAGDQLLREAAGKWGQALREVDFLARIGGEEFAVLLPACSSEEAYVVIERLRAATPGEVTCSGGVAQWDREESAESLLARADIALYDAKRAGRDRAEVVARR